jgi:hypothetical protein
MANPNIVNVSNILGKTANFELTTSITGLVLNPSNSNKIFKINSVLVANIDGLAAADVTISYGSPGSPPVVRPIASTVTVPNDSTLVVISKDTSIYLEEGRGLYGFASANGDLVVTISYEEIS